MVFDDYLHICLQAIVIHHHGDPFPVTGTVEWRLTFLLMHASVCRSYSRVRPPGLAYSTIWVQGLWSTAVLLYLCASCCSYMYVSVQVRDSCDGPNHLHASTSCSYLSTIVSFHVRLSA